MRAAEYGVTSYATFSNPHGVVDAIRRSQRLLKPPPNIKPSDWAERNVHIPVGNAIPGLIRFDNAPYQREPLDMMASEDCTRITLMWGAQVGKTTLALCGQAYFIGCDPRSQMMMQPSQGDLTTWLETKFDALVDENRTLKKLIAKPRGRDGVNNQRMKSYPGGWMMYSWSGSPKTMRGRSAPVIVCDEIDGYDRTKEGHPVSLLRKRAATFGDQSVVLEISTPTIKGESWIENAFDSGDKRRFHVPCPHCGEHQVLHWANVHWDKDDNGTPLPETASYQCAHCGVLWSEAERRGAIRLGEWRAEKPFFGHASYHLSELYSTLCDLRSIVQSFLDAKAAGDLQTFINTSLAETWEEDGARVDEQALMSRAESFDAEVPDGGVYLTAGVDMQEDRLELEVVAWGLGEESWSVDYRVLWGDPTQGQVWEELDEALDQTYSHANGSELSIMAACLDTGGGEGGYTQAAYEYARSRGTSRIYAIKGVGGFGRPIISKPTKVSLARKGRRVNVFPLGVDEIKVMVTRRLALQNPGPGYCHIPDDRDPEWFAQMCAEKLVTKYRKGHPFREWHQTRARNEAFDCRGYAYAALKIKKPNLKSMALRLDDGGDDGDGAAKVPEETPRSTGQVKARPRKRRARAKTGGYVKNY